ncbi:hypothetical protein QT995_15255 [Microcoleus sp. S36b_A3]|uniref:hypothetical protein n=1 Tax=unclassified Microcoleus TaxID=2642155 RepID=UPI002FCF8A29
MSITGWLLWLWKALWQKTEKTHPRGRSTHGRDRGARPDIHNLLPVSRGSATVSQLPPEILPSSLAGRRRTQKPALGLKHLSEKPRFCLNPPLVG